MTLLRLAPLASADVAAFLTSAGAPAGRDWAAFTERHSGGNPLFLRELVRLLRQEGAFARPAPPTDAPAEMGRLLAYRLKGLSPECRALIGACSAAGDEIDLPLLNRLVPSSGPLLNEAVAAGVLVEDPAAPSRLRFAHVLIQQAAYGELDRDERVGWHRRIADALAQTAGTEERSADIARHRLRAAVDVASCRAAVTACRAAAEAADSALAFDGAISWLDQALELLPSTDLSDAERADLRTVRAGMRYRAGRVDEALEDCTEAARLAARTGRPDLLATAALTVRNIGGPQCLTIADLCAQALAAVPETDVATRSRLLALRSEALTEIGELAEAVPLSSEALTLADASGDLDARIEAVQAGRMVTFGDADMAPRLALTARLRELGEATGRPRTQLWAALWRIEDSMILGALAEVDKGIVTLAGVADRVGWPLAQWHLHRAQAARAGMVGQFDEAERQCRAAGKIGEELQDGTALALQLAFLTNLLSTLGRIDEIQDASLDLIRNVGAPIGLAAGGLAFQRAGHPEIGAELLGRLRPQLPTLPRDTRWLPTAASGGELAALQGDVETAELCYERVLPFDTFILNAMAGLHGSVARNLGVMATALGRLDDADRHLREAVALEQRAGCLPQTAISRLDHARLLALRGAPGDRERALAEAEKSHQVARRLNMTPTATAAGALAQELSGVRAGAATLTGREREVAGLVAAGLTNRAIAERLVLSERTVETHVRSVLAKLGLSNRTQVASWAARALPGQ